MVAFEIKGPAWVDASDGRSVHRTGRETIEFHDGPHRYVIPCEIAPGGVGVLPSALHDESGVRPADWAAVWARTRELLEVAGGRYDPYPDDAMRLGVAERWSELNEYEGVVRLDDAPVGLLPHTPTYARYVASGEQEWRALAQGMSALVRLELSVGGVLDDGRGPDWWQEGAATTVRGTVAAVDPPRLRLRSGCVLALGDAGPLVAGHTVHLYGVLDLVDVRPVPA